MVHMRSKSSMTQSKIKIKNNNIALETLFSRKLHLKIKSSPFVLPSESCERSRRICKTAEERILLDIQRNPRVSARDLSARHSVSRTTILCSILKENGTCPYLMYTVQAFTTI
ncbi:hypothetical protein ANTQUA_LOCUS8176 [Anthophora quadrimaculata]